MGDEKWTSSISLENLIERSKRDRNTRYEKILVDGIAHCDNRSLEPMDGEEFKIHPEADVLVSNFGRVLSKDRSKILEQIPDPDPARYDYLYVQISGNPAYKELVYRLVAETWCERPDTILYNIVHHISNNGYDNSAENLMWVTKTQHAMIHPFLKERKNANGF